MQSMDIQSEEFELLLAEALRAGPGTPSWRQAVEILRDAGEKGEEFAMLCRAREDLASGREYRSIQAGPGFTRKLMESIDDIEKRQWNLPTANIVATLAVMIVTLVVVIGAWMLFAPAKEIRTEAELLETYFVTPAAVAEFHTEQPAGLKPLGVLPIVVEGGAKVQVQTRRTEKPVGGGFVMDRAVAADETIAVESAIEIDRADTDLITQLYVTDRPDFAADTGLTSHELVCLVENGRARVVLPDGRTAQEAALAAPTGRVNLRIRLNRDWAVVEMDGKAIWQGRHGLSGEDTRYFGVRLLTLGGEKSTGVSIESLRLLKP